MTRFLHVQVANEHSRILLLLIVLQILVNLVGVLGPEIAFDANWYHLTIPKLFLAEGKILFIPGGLLYYTSMPKLVDLLYMFSIAFETALLAKALHFLFGLLTLIVIYKLSRLFVNSKIALLCCVVFYANLVVGWQSTTSYIDLARTFFEALSVYLLFSYFTSKKNSELFLSSIMIGLAIATKLLAVVSLIPLVLLILMFLRTLELKKQIIFSTVLLYVSTGLIMALPWFFFSYTHTGNPIYPFLSSLYPLGLSSSLFSPVQLLNDALGILLFSSDPISPIYFMTLPLIFLVFSKLSFREKLVVLYCCVAYVVWYFTPRTGGGRFLLPYLPMFSVLVGIVVTKLATRRGNQLVSLKNILLIAIFFTAFLSIGYRGLTNAKYCPVVFGLESEQSFLMRYLNFSFGDFVDVDGMIEREVGANPVYLVGFHNLYYVDLPFVHESWERDGRKYPYIAVQHKQFPKEYEEEYVEVLSNKKTGVTLYKRQ